MIEYDPRHEVHRAACFRGTGVGLTRPSSSWSVRPGPCCP